MKKGTKIFLGIVVCLALIIGGIGVLNGGLDEIKFLFWK